MSIFSRPRSSRARSRLIAGLVAAILLPGRADADQTEIEDLSLEEMLGVVEGVTRFEEPVARAPAAVSIIGSAEIARSGARDIIELFRYVVGVHVVSHTQDSHSVAIRGLDDLAGNSIVLLIDGHHFTNVFDGGTDWTSLPVTLDDIERIEVVRGPVSVIYGANASAGVINVVRKGAGAETSTYSAIAGAPMTYEVAARMVRTFDRIATKISARHTGASIDAGLAEETSRQTTFDAAAWWKVAEGRQLDVAAGSSIGVGDRVSPLFPTPIRLTTVNLMQSASYTHGAAMMKGDELSVRQSLHRRSIDPAIGGSSSDDLQRLQYQKIDLEASYRAQLTDKLDAGASTSIRHVVVESDAIEGGRSSLPFYAAGLTAGLRLGSRVDLRAGARFDYNEFVIDPKPSFRVAGSVAVTDDHLLRAAVGNAFRHPTFAEAIGVFRDPESEFLYLVGAGTRALRPPEVTGAEVGYRGRLAVGLSADLTVFASASNGNITQEHRSIPSTFVNGGDETHGGVEAELRYTGAVAQAAAGYTIIHAFEEPAMSTPASHRAHLSLGADLPLGLRGDVRASFTSLERYQTLVGAPASLLQMDIDPILLVTARAAYAVPGTRMTVALLLAGLPLLSARESPYPDAFDHVAHGYATVQYDY